PPPAPARVPGRAGLGWRSPRPQPAHATPPGRLRPADPPRLRHHAVPGARAGGDAATRRQSAGPPRSRAPRPRLGTALRSGDGRGLLCRRPLQPSAVPDDPPLSGPGLPGARHPAAGPGAMALLAGLAVQGVQMLLILLLAPLL